jgi:4-hydroxybenzoate polyprenyltransferase
MIERTKDIFRLIRWQNLLFLAILMWVLEKWLVVPLLYSHGGLPEVLPEPILWLLILSVVLIAAGGYVINDYFDIKIDRINRPDRVIVGETMTKPAAMHLSIGLSVAGILVGLLVAWLCHSWTLGIVILLMPGLLWFYSSAYKRQFLVGNLIVAFASAAVPMLLGLANEGMFLPFILAHDFQPILDQLQPVIRVIYTWLGGFALMIFLYTWIREVIKDLQDQMGDRELECRTMPIRLGELWTKILLTVMIAITIGVLCWFVFGLLPFPHTWNSMSVRYLTFGLIIPLLCVLALVWAARIPSDYRNAQRLMKLAMLLGLLYSYVIYVQLCA